MKICTIAIRLLTEPAFYTLIINYKIVYFLGSTCSVDFKFGPNVHHKELNSLPPF